MRCPADACNLSDSELLKGLLNGVTGVENIRAFVQRRSNVVLQLAGCFAGDAELVHRLVSMRSHFLFLSNVHVAL